MKIKKPVSAPETQRKIKRSYLTVATVAARRNRDGFACVCGRPAATINALSDFVFSAIKAIGAILLGFGIVQIGLALKSHDAGQRAQGFMTFFGWRCHLLCQGYSGYDSVRRSTTLIILDYFPGKCYIILSKIPILSVSIMR